MSGRQLGRVVGGSLSEGLEVRLDPGVSVEEVTQGTYVVIEGQRQKFFGMITDVLLGTSNPQFTAAPPDMSDSFIAEVMTGTSIYGILKVMPMVVPHEEAALPEDRVRPVKTVPTHFSPGSSRTS
ncbi:MAG: ATPase, partial [Chloroflexi bacterium]|nr:ATPase [Chloroflexota bacterium]